MARYPEAQNKALLLPNAVDTQAFAAVPDDKIMLRKKLGLPDTKILVGYVGRFEPLGNDKGLHLMIDAVKDLPDNVIVLLVGGAKAEITQYAAYAASKGLKDRIVLVPYVTSGLVAEYEKACDVLAYVPSARNAFFEKETSPMKLFEYMAARRPIIVSDSPAMREILDDASALFVEPGSAEQFVAAVERLIAHPEEGAHLADAAFKKYRIIHGSAARKKLCTLYIQNSNPCHLSNPHRFQAGIPRAHRGFRCRPAHQAGRLCFDGYYPPSS